MNIEVVYCTNCGHGLYVSPSDVKENCKNLHSVCPICYEPIEVKNPFFKEEQ